jgi:hypothetical protein
MEHGNSSAPASHLERLVHDTLQDMQRLGYSPKYLRLCRGVWRDFLSSSGSVQTPEALSEPAVARFLASRGIPTEDAPVGFGLPIQ